MADANHARWAGFETWTRGPLGITKLRSGYWAVMSTGQWKNLDYVFNTHRFLLCCLGGIVGVTKPAMGTIRGPRPTCICGLYDSHHSMQWRMNLAHDKRSDDSAPCLYVGAEHVTCYSDSCVLDFSVENPRMFYVELRGHKL